MSSTHRPESDAARLAFVAPPLGTRVAVSLALVFASLVAACTADEGVPPQEWNVVLISLDTVRADALGAYGQSLDVTPRLDQMAAEGLLFEQVVSAAPHTLASHASIMTGLYPFSHGVRGNHGYRLAPENLTLAEILRDRGHRTRAEISAPVLRSGTHIAQGFEDAEPPTTTTTKDRHPTQSDTRAAREPDRGAVAATNDGLRRSAENISQRGIDYIRSRGEEPFFLWLHYFDAHLPYHPRAADQVRFPDDPYLAQVAALDREVARVLDAIVEAGLRERTLVVLTSDHGEGLGEHAEPTHSYFVYETTMRVPLIFWGPPTVPRGMRVSETVRTIDILPSVLDWMEIETPPEVQGRSLRRMAEGGHADSAALEGAPAYGEALDLYRLFGSTPLRLLRHGNWKYIHSAAPELYDLADDPEERRNLIETHPEVAERLYERLEQLLADAPPARGDAHSEVTRETAAQLLALGYLAPESRVEGLDEVAQLARTGPDPGQLARHAERLSRAKGSIAAKKWDRALAALAPVREAHPRSADVLSMVGEALAGKGEEDASLDVFRRALEVSREPCSHVRLDYARALDRFGRGAQRIEVLEDALVACPDSGIYQNALAWALATESDPRLRDGARAVEVALRLIDGSEGESDPNALDTLAAAHAADQDFDRAARVQEEALDILIRAGAPRQIRSTYQERAERYRKQAADAGPGR